MSSPRLAWEGQTEEEAEKFFLREQIEDLKAACGEGYGAQVEHLEDEERFLVRFELGEGLYVEGGQEVELLVSGKEQFPTSAEEDVLIPEGVTISAFKIQSLKVNGAKVLDEGSSAYIAVVEGGDYFPFFCSPVSKNVGITRLVSADDLVALFHEKGHASDPELDEGFILALGRFKEILEEKGEDAAYDPEGKQIWLWVVSRESLASKSAVKLMKPLAPRIFPKDTNLDGAKRCLTAGLIQPCYVGTSGKFPQSIGPEEMERLTRF